MSSNNVITAAQKKMLLSIARGETVANTPHNWSSVNNLFTRGLIPVRYAAKFTLTELGKKVVREILSDKKYSLTKQEKAKHLSTTNNSKTKN